MKPHELKHQVACLELALNKACEAEAWIMRAREAFQSADPATPLGELEDAASACAELTALLALARDTHRARGSR